MSDYEVRVNLQTIGEDFELPQDAEEYVRHVLLSDGFKIVVGPWAEREVETPKDAA